jgi:hypothetical protein
VPPTHGTRKPRSHPLASGSQTKARTPDLNGSAVLQLKDLSNTTTPASTRPQTVVSCSVASSAVTKDDTEPGPTKEVLSSSSTSGRSSRKNGKSKKVRRMSPCLHLCFDHVSQKQVQKAENPTAEITPPPESVSSEQGSIQESPPVKRDQVSFKDGIDGLCYSTWFQEEVLPSKQYICRNYLHKRCSQDPCPHYHDPSLVSLSVLDTIHPIESRRRTMPPLCLSLYEGRCTRNVCIFYHPEVNRLSPGQVPISHRWNSKIATEWSAENSSDPNAMIRTVARYHFRLPAVRIAFLFSVNYSQWIL